MCNNFCHLSRSESMESLYIVQHVTNNYVTPYIVLSPQQSKLHSYVTSSVTRVYPNTCMYLGLVNTWGTPYLLWLIIRQCIHRCESYTTVDSLLPYLSSQICSSFFLRASQIFSVGLPKESGFVTSLTSLVADISAAPM
jgi:hypothetical protein